MLQLQALPAGYLKPIQSIRAGCDGYATKPVDRIELLQVIRAAGQAARQSWTGPELVGTFGGERQVSS